MELVQYHNVAVFMREEPGRPPPKAMNLPNRFNPPVSTAMDNYGRLLVNFYSKSLLCVHLPSVVGSTVLTVIILIFHVMTFA